MLGQDPLISYRNVDKAFGNHVIYKGLSLDVKRSETLCIIGPSGVGKSVMVKMLIGLLDTDAGQIYFDGEDVAQLTNDKEFIAIRRRVAMVFQGAALFDSMSVYENIAYPLREQFDLEEDDISHRVDEKLTWVGLPGIEQKMPAELSGGMKKRVGLARAIATDPEVILYDEPTTGLDPVNVRRIGDLILSLSERLKCTSLVVTHDMMTVNQISDRVAFVYGQKIRGVGHRDSLRKGADPIVRGFMEGDPAPFEMEDQ
ncbi:MAG: ATP-binding cassette domain-containing protein [Deltaproteobacteria bacterium]|nr:ATP-binding cassette domain-containing protein [Deltaproteobacteria bacterium]